MDLRLFSRVIWRFRLIVGAGFVLACLLAFLSVASISFSGGSPTIRYRQAETWKGNVLLFVTQKGFPMGYTVLPGSTQAQGPNTPSSGPTTSTFGTPGWFTSLAVYYAPFVESDPYHAILDRDTQVRGAVSAQAVTDQHNLAQPYIALSAYASTQADAATLANAGAHALQQYILQQQKANGIPPKQRVILQVVASASPGNTLLFAGRKKTTPIVIFLTVLLAAIGLAFVLENLRPRVQSLPAGDEPHQPLPARRTA